LSSIRDHQEKARHMAGLGAAEMGV